MNFLVDSHEFYYNKSILKLCCLEFIPKPSVCANELAFPIILILSSKLNLHAHYGQNLKKKGLSRLVIPIQKDPSHFHALFGKFRTAAYVYSVPLRCRVRNMPRYIPVDLIESQEIHQDTFLSKPTETRRTPNSIHNIS